MRREPRSRKPGNGGGSSRRLWIVLAALALAAIVALLIHFVPPPRPDCSFSGWKRAVGVDLEAKAGELEAIQAKVGLTSSEVREFDTLLKDYAVKYDAACNDVRNGRMNQAEYTCRRRNMDQLLDSLRTFGQAVDAAKTIADPKEQASQIRVALERLSAASKSGYGAGCVSAMAVDPRTLTFAEQTPERSLHIGNGGNNELTFAIDGLPEAFLAQPTTGVVARGAQPVTVSIYRTILPVDATHPVTFRVRSNLEEELTIEIVVNGSATALYQKLGAEAAARAGDHQPTVADAVAVVDPLVPPGAANRPAATYFLAMNVLTQAGQNEQALEAYQAAAAKSPELASSPVALLSQGVVLSRKGDADRAVAAFASVQEAPGSPGDPAKSAAAVLAASVELSRGRKSAAESRLAQAPGAHSRVQFDKSLEAFAMNEYPGIDLARIPDRPRSATAKKSRTVK
jgi:tetratricopeptide (TPR) repeat protein